MQPTLSHQIGITNRILRKNVEQYLKPFQLTAPQWGILRIVYEKKVLSQTEIAKYIGADKMTTGTIIDKLVGRGFLERSVSEKDKRSYQVSLTEQGQDIVEKLKEDADARNRESLACLTPEEQDHLRDYLERIIERNYR